MPAAVVRLGDPAADRLWTNSASTSALSVGRSWAIVTATPRSTAFCGSSALMSWSRGSVGGMVSVMVLACLHQLSARGRPE
jgi:hypothetical protein